MVAFKDQETMAELKLFLKSAVDDPIEQLRGELKEARAIADTAKAGQGELANKLIEARNMVKVIRSQRDSFDVSLERGSIPSECARGIGLFAQLVLNRGGAREEKAAEALKDMGFDAKAMSEGVDSAGGALVPEIFVAQLLKNVERHGVARRVMRITPMSSDTHLYPIRTGGLTTYYPGEGGTITTSDPTLNNVRLTAKKLATLTAISNELDADSAIAIGAFLADEIAIAFATHEDDKLFNGDGTSTYGGTQGLRNSLLGLSSTRADISGLIVGAGNLWSELTIDDIEDVAGLLPEYADANARWYCHKRFYWKVMARLALAQGGSNADEVRNFPRDRQYFMYPVEFVQKMPSVEANDHVPLLFGDINMAALFGDRRSIQVDSNTGLYFDKDQIAIRGIERIDMSVYDVGNATSTAADKVEGPIVGLLTAAS